MKRRILIYCLLAALTAHVPVYAYTKVTQSVTEEKAVIEADGYAPFETSPIIVLKPGKALSDLENATKDEPVEELNGVVEQICSSSADKDGRLNAEIDFSSSSKGYTYGIAVSGKLYLLRYVSEDYRNSVIQNMINAANAENKDELKALLSENKDCLSVDNNVLFVCEGMDLGEATEILMKELSGKTSGTVSEMADIIGKAMTTAALNKGNVKDKEIIDYVFTDGKYYEANLKLGGKISEDGIKRFLSGVSNKSYKDISQADEKMAKELVLDTVLNSKLETTTEILSVLNDLNGILGLDLSAFNRLSEGSRADVIRAFVKSKPTLNSAQNTLDELVSSYKEEGRSAQGGGSSGGSSRGSMLLPDSDSGTYVGKRSAVFNDIEGYDWAQDAVNSLYASGIISGYGDGSFKPQNSIKREEFVKIAVSAFYKNTAQGKISFSDVSESDWYYNDIAIAAKHGIINGISEELFGVGQNITRQDMAVILYRIAGDSLKIKGSFELFSDDDSISDYAKDAVYALRAAGVINGVTPSSFAPGKNATRAETAVMVYRFINLVGKGGALNE